MAERKVVKNPKSLARRFIMKGCLNLRQIFKMEIDEEDSCNLLDQG